MSDKLNYYNYIEVNSNYSSDDSVKNLIGKYETKEVETINKFTCNICNNKRFNSNENYTILSCNHVFHIICLAETHFPDIYKYEYIDEKYISDRKCPICSTQMPSEEIAFLHNKFLSNTKVNISQHQDSIDKLELQMKNIQNELKICYDYKNKLETQRDKSRQIVNTLISTM